MSADVAGDDGHIRAATVEYRGNGSISYGYFLWTDPLRRQCPRLLVVELVSPASLLPREKLARDRWEKIGVAVDPRDLSKPIRQASYIPRSPFGRLLRLR